MRQMGLEKTFHLGGHLPVVAHRSQWGASEVESSDMIQSAHGGSWILRRDAFDAMLRAAAIEAGAVGVAGPASTVRWSGERWDFPIGGESGRCSFLIDASGRRAAVSRRIGQSPVADDRLVAVSFLTESARGTDIDQTTLLEACESGWWYTCRIGSDQRLVSYFSDADLIPSAAANRSQVLPGLLGREGPIRSLLNEHGYGELEAHEVVAAHSGHLEPMVGETWMATGDAALSYDPLCGHGLIAAMDSARYAALALVERARGNAGALQDYAAGMMDAYRRYRVELRSYYRAETRWKESPFWSRRHGGGVSSG